MGRGASKIGGSVASNAGAKTNNGADKITALNDSDSAKNAAEALYDNPLTMAFPANDTIVKNVPALKSMKETMNDAPVGTTIVSSFYIGNTPYVGFMEKTSSKVWTRTDVARDTKKVSGGSKYQGRKALEQMQMALNTDRLMGNIDSGIIDAYKNR